MTRITLNIATIVRAFLAIALVTFSSWAFGLYENEQVQKHSPKKWTQAHAEASTGDCGCKIKQSYMDQHMNEASINQKQLLLFASEAAMSAFTYDFNDYRRHFQQTSQYFTPFGWDNFITSLRKSGNLNTVLDNKMVVKAIPTDAPIILQHGPVAGIYTWKVQIPMLVVYRGSAQQQAKQNLVVTLHLRRTNTIDGNGNTVAIDSLIAAPRKEHLLASTQPNNA